MACAAVLSCKVSNEELLHDLKSQSAYDRRAAAGKIGQLCGDYRREGYDIGYAFVPGGLLVDQCNPIYGSPPRDEKVISALIDNMDHPDYGVRMFSAETLGKIREPRAVPGLIKLLKDPEDTVKWYAVRALGIVGDESAKQALTEIQSNPHSYISEDATRALDGIRTRAAARPP